MRKQLRFILPILIFLAADLVATPKPAESEPVFVQPLLIKGRKIAKVLGFQIQQYGVFVAGKDHFAKPIPFQIDEINDNEDYVLDQSDHFAPMKDNGIFDPNDELVIRGTDLGKKDPLLQWKKKPFMYFEVAITNASTFKKGTIYIGIFKENKPTLSDQKLLTYDHKKGLISTSKYDFKFNPNNHILMDYVYLKEEGKPGRKKVIENSGFTFIADIKYFFTLKVSSKDLITRLNYWKVGPVRCIAQVSFFFRLLSMDIDIEMYTEVSLFENAVSLPTILNSPVDAKSLFREGSGFYYGLKLADPIDDWKFDTNLLPLKTIKDQKWSNRSTYSILKEGFWLTGNRNNLELFLELKPSTSLIKEKTEPFLHFKDTPRDFLKGSNTNIGIFMDTSNLNEGDYMINVFMFFDTKYKIPKNRGKMIVSGIYTHHWVN